MRRFADRGSALLIAVAVTAVCLTLMLIGVQLTVTSSRSSGVDRQRVLAINAAEAGIDSGYAAIQSAGVVLPCTMSSGNVRSAPDTASYSTTVAYYDAAGAALACPLGAAVPAQALIRSTATTNTLGGGVTKPTRTVEALVNLTAVGGGGGGGGGLAMTIFADGVLGGTASMTTVGSGGANADIYSNSNASCASSSNVAGSISAQADATVNSSCVVSANVWAKGKVATLSNSTVAGWAKASTGTISVTAGAVVSGNLYAGGLITYSGCSTPGKCFPSSSPGAPPALAFPHILSDDASIASWTASPGPGYTLYDDNTNCGTIADRVKTVYAKKGTPTLLRTTCAINFAPNITVTLSNDLAIFAKAGLDGNTGHRYTSSASGTQRNLHLIVPYDAATPACTTPTMDPAGGFSTSKDVGIFIYSPCDLSLADSGTVYGQVYGGSKVSIINSFSIKALTVPTYGVAGVSGAATGYSTSIVYKRETR